MNNPLLHFLRSVLRHVSPPFGGSWRGASLRRVMSYPLFRRGIGGGFFLFFIFSCGDGERENYLRQAEVQLPEHPDSAQILLNRVGNPYELSDDNRAYYGLLRTWTDDLITFEVNSDTLLRDTYLYYNKVSEEGETTDSVLLRRYAQSCYLMGRYYVSSDSTKQAEDLLRRATILADRCHDYRTTYLAYDYLSRQIVWSNQQEALDLSLKALEYCQRCMDKPSNEIAVRFNVATNYALLADTANAFKMTDTAYHIAVQNNLKMQEHEALRTYGSIYFMIEDYPKALEFTKKSFEDNLQMNEYHVIFQLASCYLYCDSLEKAKKTLLSLLSIKDVSVKSSVYWELYDIAFKQGNYSDVRIYVDSTYALNEKNLFDALELKDAYYQDVIQQEKQAEQLKYEKQLQKQKTTTAIIIAILLIAIVWLIFRRRLNVLYRKRRRSVKQHRSDIQEYTTKLQEVHEKLTELSGQIQQKEQAVVELKESIAEKETEYKTLIDKQNTAIDLKEQDIAVYTQQIENTRKELDQTRQRLTEKQAELSTLQTTFRLQEEEHSRGMDYLAKQAVSQSRLYIKLVHPHTIEDTHERKVTQEDWLEVEHILNTFYKDFAKRLKEQYPTLTEEGYQLCLMTKMGLTNKQMGSYFSIEMNAVKKRKSSLKNNVFDIQDKTIYLEQVLADF